LTNQEQDQLECCSAIPRRAIRFVSKRHDVKKEEEKTHFEAKQRVNFPCFTSKRSRDFYNRKEMDDSEK
jgi:hypothetical protein